MNNQCVPDFKIQMNEEEEEYPMPISSSAPKKPSVQSDEIMKLSWQNGQVALQSQNQGQPRKPPSLSPARNTAAAPADPSLAREAENYHNRHLFMQDDEMASWLHYSIEDDPPLDHRDFCADMIYVPPQNHRCTAELLPPIPVARRIQNFAHISKHSLARAETAALRPQARLKGAAAAAPQSTVVDSCETPAATATAAVVSRSSEEQAGKAAWSDGGGEAAATCEMTVTSSLGGSSGSAEAVVERRRKRREAEDSEFQSEDIDFESRETKKQVRTGSTSTRRSRAAEVHNLSERRRRDRINEKMRALQELIPQCNKSDKASMLDEAIEYLKSLQSQVQMMSMGCGMVPMMLPGIQQYMPPMGMGMEMGMNGPVMPFPNMLACSTSPAATELYHLGPRFPMPPFHMPHVLAPDSSRMQAANQTTNMLTDKRILGHVQEVWSFQAEHGTMKVKTAIAVSNRYGRNQEACLAAADAGPLQRFLTAAAVTRKKILAAARRDRYSGRK